MKQIVINSLAQEHPDSIAMQTFKKSNIVNQQYMVSSQFEMNMEKEFEKLFNSKFQGEPTKMYNCHGMTFASRRTGLYEDDVIQLILGEEYKEIKDQTNVLVGDIVVYYKDGIILHSATVVNVVRGVDLVIPVIRVLSKTRAYKEIEHNVNESPYGSEKRFFRINHAKPTIV